MKNNTRKFWTGQNLYNLLNMSREELLQEYPDKSWTTLKSKRTLYRKKLREGEISLEEDHSSLTDEMILRLRARLRYMQVSAAENKIKKQDIIRAVREACLEASEETPVPKVRKVTRKGKGTEEIAVLDVSDLQLGKETPTYNIEVCRDRMKRLAEDVIRISKIQSTDHPVKKIHLQVLGDIVEGEGIFPNQSHHIESGLYKQILEAHSILNQLVLDLLSYFQEVHFVGVIGNHGSIRLKGDVDPETNMDRLVYAMVRNSFQNEKRVTFDIPEGKGQRNWYSVNRVFDWGFLLAHGDQIRGMLPFNQALKKSMGWIDSIEEPWDFLHVGHHHTPTMITYNKRNVVINGSTESDNEYAQELLSATGHPTQWLGFVHPKKGVTAQYWVSLEDKIPQSKRFKKGK